MAAYRGDVTIQTPKDDITGVPQVQHTLTPKDIDRIVEYYGHLEVVQDLYENQAAVLERSAEWIAKIVKLHNELESHVSPLMSQIDTSVDGFENLYNLLQGISGELRGTLGTLERVYKYDRDVLGVASRIRSAQVTGELLSKREVTSLLNKVHLQKLEQEVLVDSLGIREDLENIKAFGDVFGSITAEEKLNEILKDREEQLKQLERREAAAIANRDKKGREYYRNEIKLARAAMTELQRYLVSGVLEDRILQEDILSKKVDRFIIKTGAKLRAADFTIKLLGKLGVEPQIAKNFKATLEEAHEKRKVAHKRVLQTAPQITGTDKDITNVNRWKGEQKGKELSLSISKEISELATKLKGTEDANGNLVNLSAEDRNNLFAEFFSGPTIASLATYFEKAAAEQKAKNPNLEDKDLPNLWRTLDYVLNQNSKEYNPNVASLQDFLKENGQLVKYDGDDPFWDQISLEDLRRSLPELTKVVADLAASDPGGVLGKDAVKNIKEAAHEVNRAAEEEAQKTFDTLKPKIGALFKGIDWGKTIKGGLEGALIAVLAGAVKKFADVSSEAARVKQLTGEWQIGLASSNAEMATTQDVLKTIQELSEQITLNPTQIFTAKELGQIAEAKNLMGFTAEQAGNLGIYAKLAGEPMDRYRQSLGAGIKQGMGLNNTIVNVGTATREALNASDAIKISMGNNAQAIGRATVAAQALGMTLKDMEGIAQNLINFQSSIEAEMQAQLLTGRQLYLAKARELALNNDLEGVAREISRQGITMAEYGRMYYIQQENLAKALGMSRDQMAKMLIMDGLRAGLSKEAIARQMKMNTDQIQAVGVAEAWRKSVEKLQEAFTPILNLVVLIIEPISKLINQVASVIGWLTRWTDAATTAGSAALGYASGYSGVMSDIDKKYARLAEAESDRTKGLQQTVGVTGAVKAGFAGIGATIMSVVIANTLFRKGLIATRNVASSMIRDLRASLTAIGNLFTSRGRKHIAWTARDFVRSTDPRRRDRTVNLDRKAIRSLGGNKAPNPGKLTELNGGKSLNRKVKEVMWDSERTTKMAGTSNPGALRRLGRAIKSFVKSLGSPEVLRAAASMGIMALSLGGTALLLAHAAKTLEGVSVGAILEMSAIFAGLVVATKYLGSIFRGLEASGKTVVSGSVYILAAVGVLAAIAGIAWLFADGVKRIGEGAAMLGSTSPEAVAALVAISQAMAVMSLSSTAFVISSFFIRGAMKRVVESLNGLVGKTDALAGLAALRFSGVSSELKEVAESIASVGTALDSISITKVAALAALSILPRRKQVVEPQGEQEEIRGRSSEIEEVNKVLPALKTQVIHTEAIRVEPKAGEQPVQRKVSSSTNTGLIEQKMDLILQAIRESKPDWNWLRFDEEYAINVPFRRA